MRRIFWDSGEKSYFLSADYRLSTLTGSDFEMIQEITGTLFRMTLSPAISAGANGEFEIISWGDNRIAIGTSIYAALPVAPELQSAFVADYLLTTGFRLSSSLKTEATLFYQNMGVISDFSSQNSNAAGLRFTFWYD